MKANKKIEVTPTGKIEFTREAKKWIGRKRSNLYFWDRKFLGYLFQNWGEVSEWRWELNNKMIERISCLDIEAKYSTPDGKGFITVRGKYDDDIREVRTLIDWINYQDSKPTKIEVKQPGRIIQLDINCY